MKRPNIYLKLDIKKLIILKNTIYLYEKLFLFNNLKILYLGIKLSPRDVANKLVENVQLNSIIEKLEVAGPGFINIYVSKDYASKILASLIKNGVEPPSLNKKLKVVIDFSSPNVAKEMHVGHLRFVSY